MVIIDRFMKQAGAKAIENAEITDEDSVDDYLDSVMLEMEGTEEDPTRPS